MVSYLKHWKLSRSPFHWENVRSDFFCGGSTEEAIARAEFLVENNRKLGVIVGPSGVGKTCTLEYFAHRRASIGNERIQWIDLKYADSTSLAQRIHQSLLEEGGDRTNPSSRSNLESLWREIDDVMTARKVTNLKTLFLFDNAGLSTEDAIQSLGVLLTSRWDWMALLCVDEQLLVDLPRRILESCELRIDLPPWDLGQTADFFEHITDRFAKQSDIFTAQAVTRIQELSDGLPRRIVQLGDLTLVAGAVRHLARIDADLVDQVFDEFSLNFGSKIHSIWQS